MNDVSVVVFSSREDCKTLASTIDAVILASKNLEVNIDVVVNGNEILAKSIKDYLGQSTYESTNDTFSLRIWHLGLGDKSNAWNHYAHEIYNKSSCSVFVDGYVRINDDALVKIFHEYDRVKGLDAVTGVPTKGWSARRLRNEMIKYGGIHGNLYSLSGKLMDRIQSMGFRFPLGLYRGDPYLGACINFDFDPFNNVWNPSLIKVMPDVTWNIKTASPLGVAYVKGYLKRKKRQKRGEIENAAIKTFLSEDKNLPTDMPWHINYLILEWYNSIKSDSIAKLDKNIWREIEIISNSKEYWCSLKKSAQATAVLVHEI